MIKQLSYSLNNKELVHGVFLYFLISGINQPQVFNLKKILLSFVILLSSYLVFGQNAESLWVVNPLLEKLNSKQINAGRLQQIVVAFKLDMKDKDYKVMGLEKTKGKWKLAIAPVKASIGRNGFAQENDKMEGDGKTPKGLYALGKLYSYDAAIDTKLHFQQVDSLDKWIDDSSSNDYNKYVRGETNAKSFEHLKLNSIDYKYCMVIEYNTQPVVKGKGSAIFFHVANESYAPTAGCVAIAENDMLQFLKWFKPNKQKAIWINGIVDVWE
jgi:L,D-peptidoglycan transpeptidase YkuD (ErfK/YbiS/YcfS/YnhG family)